MRSPSRLLLSLAAACACAASEPAERAETAAHRAAVYEAARTFVMETFNLEPKKESDFEARRFEGMGVWGDFEARLKELGGDRYEVQGWVVPAGHFGRQIKWTVVIEYPMPDPQAWRRQRLDVPSRRPSPRALSWKLGGYRSAPYAASPEDGRGSS